MKIIQVRLNKGDEGHFGGYLNFEFGILDETFGSHRANFTKHRDCYQMRETEYKLITRID